MTPNKPVTVLYDGSCPMCRREAAVLSRLDRGKGVLILEDISGCGFEPGRYGRSMQELMAEIHGVLPDGAMVTGMEVFRRAYGAVGLSWLLAPTGWPIIRGLADRTYAWFARNRLRFGGGVCACVSSGDQTSLPLPTRDDGALEQRRLEDY